MVDTVRTRSALATLFADNATGDISAQDLRDFLASAFVVSSGAGIPSAQSPASTPASDFEAYIDTTTGDVYFPDQTTSPLDWVKSFTIRDEATAANIRAGAANKVITPAGIELAAEEVTLTDAATISFDWSSGINFNVTLAGNRIIDEPTNGEPGTTRLVRVIQDGTGSRTLAWGNNSPAEYYHPSGTAPTLTTTAGAIDVFTIYCVSATTFYVFTAGQAMAAV